MGKMGNKRKRRVEVDQQCPFCMQSIDQIDYKDLDLLRRFVSGFGKLSGRKKIGTCAKHQRKLMRAVKRARILALLPFVGRAD